MSHPKHCRTARAGQVAADPTMTTVESGDVTACYYIMFSNLQKKTTSKHVEDYLRQGRFHEDQFDKVKVFRSVRNGWVRVWGAENMRKILAYLKCEPLRGKELIVACQNENQRTMVKDVENAQSEAQLVSTSTLSNQGPAQYPAQYPVQYQTQLPHGYQPQNVSWPSTTTPSAGPASFYGPSSSYAMPAAMGYAKTAGSQQHNKASEYAMTNPTSHHSGDPRWATSRNLVRHSQHERTIELDKVDGSSFKIVVMLNRPGSITEDLAKDFVTRYSPSTRQAVLRVDSCKGHRKETFPTAEIVFNDVFLCAQASYELMHKNYGGLVLDMSPHPDRNRGQACHRQEWMQSQQEGYAQGAYAPGGYAQGAHAGPSQGTFSQASEWDDDPADYEQGGPSNTAWANWTGDDLAHQMSMVKLDIGQGTYWRPDKSRQA